MNNLPELLNSVTDPGDFIRLAFTKSLDNEVIFEVEGGGEYSDRLSERIATVFRSEERNGFEFERRPLESPSTDELQLLSFFDVLPRARRLSERPSSLGFAPGTGERPSTKPSPLFVPAFHRNPRRPLSAAPLFLLLSGDTVGKVEIDFARWELPEDWKRLLNQAEGRREIPRSSDTPDFLGHFLRLWQGSEVGWEVRLRVGLNTSTGQAPTALLELAGRDFFQAPCKVRPCRSERRAVSHSPVMDLSFRFPEGWAFSDIFPAEEERERLVARRKYHAVTPELPKEGIVVGTVEGSPLRLPDSTRDRHTYIAGATGTGKSTLLKRLIGEDLREGRSLILLDPHGDLYTDVLESMPEDRWEDLFVIDPRSRMKPPGFNFMQIPRDQFFRRRVDFLIGELLRFFQETWQKSDAFGPMFELYYRNSLLLLLLQDKIPVTMMDFERVFSDSKFRESLLEVSDDVPVKHFWQQVAVKVSGEASLQNISPYITSKMHSLTQGGFLTEMIAQSGEEVQLEERMNSGGVILVNLDKGILGPNQSRLLGTLLTMQIFAAGLKRSILPVEERRPVNIYIDEFQNFVSDNIASMLSEARKFGLRLHLANQTLSQLSNHGGGSDLLQSVLGNVGNMILFRLGIPDAERLESHFGGFTRRQMQELKNYHALARLLTDEGPLPPVIMKTMK